MPKCVYDSVPKANIVLALIVLCSAVVFQKRSSYDPPYYHEAYSRFIHDDENEDCRRVSRLIDHDLMEKDLGDLGNQTNRILFNFLKNLSTGGCIVFTTCHRGHDSFLALLCRTVLLRTYETERRILFTVSC